MARKTKEIAEFGDFQTPDGLAREVLRVIHNLGLSPRSVIEPSCGCGAFLVAAKETFPDAELFGLDVNADYLATTRHRLADHPRLALAQESFFRHDWTGHLAELVAPLLVLGNPPWVTNSELGALGSDNLPIKSNFQNMKGLDAVTGKANFDISEWMLLQNIQWLLTKGGALAVLCKTTVARKILASAWKRNVPIADARIYRIDAVLHFGAAVEACLFVVQIDGRHSSTKCAMFPNLQTAEATGRFGFADQALVSDIDLYRRHSAMGGINKAYTWRSGIKHDCSKIMELDRTIDGLRNGLGQIVNIEDSLLYPLVKSSDIAGSRQRGREKLVIVTQRAVGDDTRSISRVAPRTWDYLLRHRDALDGRTSVIYRKKPAFSIFGVGAYSFAPWKIAISGLYKKFVFRLYGSHSGKPTVFDDTVYFLPFDSFDEANNILEMLNSKPAQEFLESMVFWDQKRPITVDLLRRMDIAKLAEALGRSRDLSRTRSAASYREQTDALAFRFA